MEATIEIKGIRDGLLVTLPEGDWPAARSQLISTVVNQRDFFRGARLALQVLGTELGAAEMGSLRDELAEHEVNLWAVLSSAKSTESAAADLGLARALTPAPQRADEADAPTDIALPGEEAILIQRTLRSGYSVRYPGHVFVLGDVNPGAEIIAGGNIIIWGRLRGVVHAGAAGDEQAVVCALDLAPTQLRIAGQISVSPSRKGKPRPEMALIRDSQLIAEAWEKKRG